MQRSRNLEENRQKIGLKSQSRVAYSRARANWKIYAGMNTHWFRRFFLLFFEFQFFIVCYENTTTSSIDNVSSKNNAVLMCRACA